MAAANRLIDQGGASSFRTLPCCFIRFTPPLPKVPTLDERGLKGFEVKVWHGMYAPKGTPAPVLTQINTAMRAAMAEPSIVQRLGELSSEIPSADKMTAKGLEDHLKAEINKWDPVIRKAGVTAD
jgi:tripartite-type tricarboxylate transporter receptor subunit TctC